MPSSNQLPDEGVFWRIYTATDCQFKGKAIRKVKGLVRKVVLKKFAEQYRIQAEDINNKENAAIYTTVSLVMTLLFPKSKRAEQNLRREIDRGSLPFSCGVQIARGNIERREEYVQPRSVIIRKTVIELSALIDSVCDLASKHGYSVEEIRAALDLAAERLNSSQADGED